MHTLLSFLLTNLAGKYRPICICSGTNNGDIISITEMANAIYPQVLPLSTLGNDYWEYWKKMTDNNEIQIKIEGDEELIEFLAFASY